MSGASYMTVYIHFFEEQSKSLRSRVRKKNPRD